MPDPDHFVKVGDTGTVVSDILRSADGNPVDITGASVRFKMMPIGGGTVKVDAPAVNAGPAAGSVYYTWAGTNIDTPGWYTGEWKVTYGGGAIQTFPNGAPFLVLVSPRIGTL